MFYEIKLNDERIALNTYNYKSKSKLPYYFITHMAITTIQRRHVNFDPTFGHPLEI